MKLWSCVFQAAAKRLEERKRPFDQTDDGKHKFSDTSDCDHPEITSSAGSAVAVEPIDSTLRANQHLTWFASLNKQSHDEGYVSVKCKASENAYLLADATMEHASQRTSNSGVVMLPETPIQPASRPSTAKMENLAEFHSKQLNGKKFHAAPTSRLPLIFAFVSHVILLNTLLNESDPNTVDILRHYNTKGFVSALVDFYKRCTVKK